MRIPLCSICTVLVLSIGCVGEDAVYLPGELPDFWASGGGNELDCHLEVDGPSPGGDRDARPAIQAFAGMTGRALVGVGASIQHLGFNTSSCED